MDVFIDSCAVNRFAHAGVDPTQALAESEFGLCATPDLRTEYQQAIDHSDVSLEVKKLAGGLLKHCKLRGFFGWGGPPFAGFGEGFFASERDMVAIDDVPISRRSRNPLPKNRTDSHLVALGMNCLVITGDLRQIRKWGQKSPGLIAWCDLATDLEYGITLAECLRKRSDSIFKVQAQHEFP